MKDYNFINHSEIIEKVPSKHYLLRYNALTSELENPTRLYLKKRRSDPLVY